MVVLSSKITELETTILELTDRRSLCLDQLRSTLQQQLQAVSTDVSNTAVLSTDLVADPGPLVAQLVDLQTCIHHNHKLQALQIAVRTLEQAVRAVDRAQTVASMQSFVDTVNTAVAAFRSAVPALDELTDALTHAGFVVSQVSVAAEALATRLDHAQQGIRQAVEEQLRARLVKLRWPPEALQAAAAPGAGVPGEQQYASSAWPGYIDSDTGIKVELQQLLGALVLLQQAVQAAAFRAVIQGKELEGPVLWAVQLLVQPMCQQLHQLWAGAASSTMPAASRLFGMAVRVAARVGQPLQPLQSVLDALQLGALYDIQFEAARAVREEVKQVLRQHVLPSLPTTPPSGIWKLLADDMITFETKFAPLHGVSAEPGSIDLVPSWQKDAVLTVLYEQTTWTSCWLASELEVAATELEGVCDADSGWQPVSQLWSRGTREEAQGDTGEGAEPAWRQEFYPPYCAEFVVAQVTSLIRRSAWCSGRSNRRRYLKDVPGQLLKAFRARLQRTGKAAETHRELTGPIWGPRLANCICAAHYLEHQLAEPEVVALLAADAAEGAADVPTPGSAASPVPDGTRVVTSLGGSLSAILERESKGFAWLKREWTLKMAKAVAGSFTDGTRQYRRQLARFSVETEVQFTHRTLLPSPSIVAALESLQSTLLLLSQHMDADTFRELWKAVAVAANMLLFNDVVTEARFSAAGAAQFAADLDAVLSLFTAFTPRPAAHFRELCEARTLLLLSTAEALNMRAVLSAGDSKAALAALTVHRLSPVQAVTVLEQRADLQQESQTYDL